MHLYVYIFWKLTHKSSINSDITLQISQHQTCLIAQSRDDQHSFPLFSDPLQVTKSQPPRSSFGKNLNTESLLLYATLISGAENQRCNRFQKVDQLPYFLLEAISNIAFTPSGLLGKPHPFYFPQLHNLLLHNVEIKTLCFAAFKEKTGWCEASSGQYRAKNSKSCCFSLVGSPFFPSNPGIYGLI